MSSPLVTVICVCYNQQQYVEHAINSVFDQWYKSIQLIVVDDGSSDQSAEVLRNLQKSKPFDLLILPQNSGYCQAFNKGWALAKGEFIIDLAGDDRLLPDRVRLGVEGLAHSNCGVQFGDVRYIDREGKDLGTHYARDTEGALIESVPSGDLYVELLRRYFICAPSMMIKRKVLESLGGYDEALSYEDFDFWVRSARSFHYQFCDQILVEKRVLPNSLSKIQYSPNDLMMRSTVKVCQKALLLNRNHREHQALAERLHYEIRQSIVCHHYHLAEQMLTLLQQTEGETWAFKVWQWLVQNRWDFTFLMPLIRPSR